MVHPAPLNRSMATVTATEGLNGTIVLCQHRNRETQNNTCSKIHVECSDYNDCSHITLAILLHACALCHKVGPANWNTTVHRELPSGYNH